MKWILRAIPILLLMVCFGGQAMPEDMPRERRVETTGESMNSSEITATFSAIDLTAVYDFLEKSFMLTDIVDLPEDVEIQKDKRVRKRFLKKILMERIVMTRGVMKSLITCL